MTTIYDQKHKEYIYDWNARNPERRREIGLASQRRYDAKKREWRNVCKLFRLILLEEHHLV